jgi:hypothetical protein
MASVPMKRLHNQYVVAGLAAEELLGFWIWLKKTKMCTWREWYDNATVFPGNVASTNKRYLR